LPEAPLNRLGPLYMGEERSQEWLCHEHKKQEQRHSCRRYVIAGKLAAGLLRSRRRPEQKSTARNGCATREEKQEQRHLRRCRIGRKGGRRDHSQECLCYELGVEFVGWDVVVAIEFQIVEGGGDAEPAGHGGGFKAGDAGFADDHNVAAAHGTADQDDFQFDWRAESQLARAKEKDAGGADVPRHQGDGEIFGAAGNTTKTEWKAQRSSGVFALFGKDTDGVSRHASKPAHWIHRLQRHHA
jgi:hypothetical protein